MHKGRIQTLNLSILMPGDVIQISGDIDPVELLYQSNVAYLGNVITIDKLTPDLPYINILRAKLPVKICIFREIRKIDIVSGNPNLVS